MTPNDFRRIALSMPGTVESCGLGYPSFRTCGRSFATIEDDVPVIRLRKEQQKAFLAAGSTMFAPAPGGWGVMGHMIVRLDLAEEDCVRNAVTTAWRNVNGEAPQGRLAQLSQLDGKSERDQGRVTESFHYVGEFGMRRKFLERKQ
jgi:hypothetical protein